MRRHDGSPITLRQYLMAKAIEAGHDPFDAVLVVIAQAKANPGWRLRRVRTYAEFERLRKGQT